MSSKSIRKRGKRTWIILSIVAVLAIARSIVEKHDGRIWAESAPGEGATIVIQIPLDNA